MEEVVAQYLVYLLLFFLILYKLANLGEINVGGKSLLQHLGVILPVCKDTPLLNELGNLSLLLKILEHGFYFVDAGVVAFGHLEVVDVVDTKHLGVLDEHQLRGNFRRRPHVNNACVSLLEDQILLSRRVLIGD